MSSSSSMLTCRSRMMVSHWACCAKCCACSCCVAAADWASCSCRAVMCARSSRSLHQMQQTGQSLRSYHKHNLRCGALS